MPTQSQQQIAQTYFNYLNALDEVDRLNAMVDERDKRIAQLEAMTEKGNVSASVPEGSAESPAP